VLIFCIGSYFILGLRGHFWRPGIFWAVPIVLCFYSYLFSVCVLIGIVTRSTLAALLLTILFWFMCWTVGSTELILLTMQTQSEESIVTYERQLKTFDERIALLERRITGTTNPSQRVIEDFKQTRQRIAGDRDQATETLQKWNKWHRLAFSVKTLF